MSDGLQNRYNEIEIFRRCKPVLSQLLVDYDSCHTDPILYSVVQKLLAIHKVQCIQITKKEIPLKI